MPRSFKVRVPRPQLKLEVVSVELLDGKFNRIAYKCGCVTIRREPAYPSTVEWAYLERCDAHWLQGKLARTVTLADPLPPDWWGP